MPRRYSVRVVSGHAGWWIYRMQWWLQPEQRYIGPYTTPARAAAAARRRGYNVQAVERN